MSDLYSSLLLQPGPCLHLSMAPKPSREWLTPDCPQSGLAPPEPLQPPILNLFPCCSLHPHSRFSLPKPSCSFSAVLGGSSAYLLNVVVSDLSKDLCSSLTFPVAVTDDSPKGQHLKPHSHLLCSSYSFVPVKIQSLTLVIGDSSLKCFLNSPIPL